MAGKPKKTATAKLQDAFFRGIARGMTQPQAARYAGVTIRQINEWRNIYDDWQDRLEAAVEKWHRDSYDEKKAKLILQLLKAGSFRSPAARAAGVDLETLLAWMVDYPEFARDVERAEAEAEAYHVANLRDKARKDWRASLAWLERKHADRWGKSETVNVNFAALTDEQLEAIAAGDLDPREIVRE